MTSTQNGYNIMHLAVYRQCHVGVHLASRLQQESVGRPGEEEVGRCDQHQCLPGDISYQIALTATN